MDNSTAPALFLTLIVTAIVTVHRIVLRGNIGKERKTMELTEQERNKLRICIESVELNSLKIGALLIAWEKGKVKSGKAIAISKRLMGENIRESAEIRTILGIPLEGSDGRSANQTHH